MKPEYFIDTSVWIPYFRESGSEHGDFIDELIDESRVHINGIVLAELLTGARSSAELDRLASALAGLKLLPSDRASSESAGRSGFALKKKGISVPLSDIIIATDCIDHDLVLIESDRHYAAIAAHLPLKRYAQQVPIPG
ncbi:MAG: PIN domain-containing protein [Candidatus Aminicenantes bacterium]|nr:PIN domain-containing protein [Candidatus Aminicenantes bacterium]